jgi:hypothetical protein
MKKIIMAVLMLGVTGGVYAAEFSALYVDASAIKPIASDFSADLSNVGRPVAAGIQFYQQDEVFDSETETLTHMQEYIHQLEGSGAKIVLYQVLAVEGGRFTFTVAYILGENVPVITGPVPFLMDYKFQPRGSYRTKQEALANLDSCLAKMKKRGIFELDSANVLRIGDEYTFSIAFHTDQSMEKYAGRSYESSAQAIEECQQIFDYASIRRVFSFATITETAGKFQCDMLYAGPTINLSEK